MPVCRASALRRRAVSSPVPVPNTRPLGSPSPRASSCVTISQGLVMLITTPLKPLFLIFSAKPRTAGIVKSISVVRSCDSRRSSIFPTQLTITSHSPRSEKIPGLKADAVREIRCGIAQILYFACELLCVFVDQYQLVRNTLYGERVSDMRAYVSQTDHPRILFLPWPNPSFSQQNKKARSRRKGRKPRNPAPAKGEAPGSMPGFLPVKNYGEILQRVGRIFKSRYTSNSLTRQRNACKNR